MVASTTTGRFQSRFFSMKPPFTRQEPGAPRDVTEEPKKHVLVRSILPHPGPLSLA
jgi:hypothetical protein